MIPGSRVSVARCAMYCSRSIVAAVWLRLWGPASSVAASCCSLVADATSLALASPRTTRNVRCMLPSSSTPQRQGQLNWPCRETNRLSTTPAGSGGQLGRGEGGCHVTAGSRALGGRDTRGTQNPGALPGAIIREYR